MKHSLNRLVCEVVARHLQVEPRSIDSRKTVQEDLELDPLDLVLIALRIEELEEFEFPIARLEQVRTVGDIAKIAHTARASEADAPPSRDRRRRLSSTLPLVTAGGALRRRSA